MKFLMAAILALASGNASAYLDPGTGSMLLQVILGGVAAVAVAVKLYWFRILSALGIRKGPSREDRGH